LDEEYGRVNEFQTSDESRAPLDKDTQFIGQKYTVGANWYPLPKLNLSAQYYHKIASYDNDLFQSQDQRLLGQDWNTDDANIRITLRPPLPPALARFPLSPDMTLCEPPIDAQWVVDGETLDVRQSGVITQHIITESINWNPLARLYLQTDFSYVLNETETPASSIDLFPNTSPTVVDFRNDYWTVTAELAISSTTRPTCTLSIAFTGLTTTSTTPAWPCLMGPVPPSIPASATLTRQLTKQVRLRLSYTYFDYTDETSGGHNNYRAHSLFSSLQFRF
jgi:hypothetical protein